jgi:hypothetical protein
MISIVLFLLASVVFFVLRHKYTVWRLSLPQRRQMAAAAKAKAKEEAKRPLTHRLHTSLPDKTIVRLLAWKPEKRIRPTVRIARRGFLGRYERINPAQHIAVIGMTGSGKSSTIRVLGAWALAAPGWYLEAWDGKWGASVRPYRGKCPVLDTIPDIEDRLRDLVERELPTRAMMADPPHLALIMDESRLLNELSGPALGDLVTLIQTGRELGVHCWFGLQDPKADSIPTAIRDQFTCKLVHMLQNQEAATVALKELVAGGWHPHKLMRSGQLLVWEPVRTPRVLLGLWLSASRLAAIPVHGPVSAPEFALPVDLTKASVRASGHGRDVRVLRRTDGRTDTLTERQSAAVMVLGEMGEMGPAALAAELGIDRNRAHDVLKQLVGKGLAEPTATGTYTLAEEQS